MSWPLFNISCCAEFIISKYENIFAFSNIYQHWNGTGSCNHSLFKTRTRLTSIFSAMFADILVTQSQGISSHCIDLDIAEYCGFCSRSFCWGSKHDKFMFYDTADHRYLSDIIKINLHTSWKFGPRWPFSLNVVMVIGWAAEVIDVTYGEKCRIGIPSNICAHWTQGKTLHSI